MKVISLWEPWATLLVRGAKRFETRPTNTHHRGPLAIAATATIAMPVRDLMCTASDFRHAVYEALGFKSRCLLISEFLEQHNQVMDLLIRNCGHIIGVVDLVDTRRTEQVRLDLSKRELLFGNYSDGRWAWLTENARPLPEPIPWKGAQGWRDLPPDILSTLNAQLGTTYA